MDKHDTPDIGEALSAWEDLGPTRPWRSSERHAQLNPRTLEIIGDLGLRFPPANSTDREAHAARVYLLAEDCSDIDPDWLDAASAEWARSKPFFPKACELREAATAYGRITRRDRILPAPVRPEPTPPPPPPPITDVEIATMAPWLVELGITAGEFTREHAEQVRSMRGK